MLKGPLGFAVFWIVALSVGVLLVTLVAGGSLGWLLLAALPAVVLLMLIVTRGRHKS